MRQAIISDSSCIIALANIGQLDLLQQVFETVLTTPQVVAEVGIRLPVWLEVRIPADHLVIERMEAELDLGEASAIALAIELHGSMLILDDLDARKVAKRLGIDVTGTVGVLIGAKRAGFIPAIRPLLDELDRAAFRMSEELRANALRLANEEA